MSCHPGCLRRAYGISARWRMVALRTEGEDTVGVLESRPGASATRPGVMIGRDDELRRGAELARDAAAGQGRLLLIQGEPGIGKTLLLRSILDEAAGLLPHVVTGAADEFDQRLPFATLHSCLQPWGHLGGQAAKVLELIRDGSAEYPVIEATLTLVEEWCVASPVAMAVEDLHWADPASILLLRRLGKVAGQLPLLLAATVRGGSGRRDVETLADSWGHDAASIQLGPLPDLAVHELVHRLAGGNPGPALWEIVAGAAGNPLYISELLTGLARGDSLRAEGDMVDIETGEAELALPPTLGEAITGRLAVLSTETRHLLQVAALMGGTFSLAEVAAVMECPATQLLGQIREASGAGVIVSQADMMAFRHPLVRAILDDDVPSSARQALHLQIARALSFGTSPERAAGHLLTAGSAAGPLLPWLASVADDLAARAPSLASALLTQVLTTPAAPAGEEVTGRLRSALAAALLRNGRPEDAEQVAQSALVMTRDPRIRAALRWTLVSAYAGRGATDRAVEEIGVALATGELTLAEQARFSGLQARCYVTLSQAHEARAAWEESIAAARTSGDTEALAFATAAAAGTRAWDGWIEDALAYSDVSVTATESLGSRAGAQLAPHVNRGICLAELDRDAQADQAYEDALRMAERGIGTDYLAWGYQCLARQRFWQGRWDEALTQIQAGLDLGDPVDMGRHLRGLSVLVAVHRGDRKTAASQLAFLSGPAPATSPGRQSAHTPTWARALAAQADGDILAATAILRPVWDEDIERDQLRYLRHYLVPDLVALQLAVGDEAAARRTADSIRNYASRRTAPALRRSVQQAAALAAGDAAKLLAVADEYQQARRPLFAAQARERAAVLLAAGGQARQAEDALRQAVGTYESLDAGWDLARADSMLRTLGVRRGKKGPRRRPRSGWEAMTETERIVAGLVAEGLSNPQIGARMYLSRRTVQYHVSSILTKLDIVSRVELAALVVRRGGMAG
jgi:DNA-binding CsgD family transcriptional regulator/tetratricopeptide (TPR) repeat protein